MYKCLLYLKFGAHDLPSLVNPMAQLPHLLLPPSTSHADLLTPFPPYFLLFLRLRPCLVISRVLLAVYISCLLFELAISC